jgi:CheY-like chemotaxis protein
MAPAALASGTNGIRILVADDQRVNQLILEAFLRKEGHTVLVANNGAEAVEMHRTEHPDLVLMDIMMPEHGWPRSRPPHRCKRRRHAHPLAVPYRDQ